jgi:hypothetical protein
MFSILFGQNQSDDKQETERFKNIKTYEDEQAEEVKIEIRKPDNAAKMPRKRTDFTMSRELEFRSKIIKSNELLY